MLSDKSDVLNCNIDIIAQPPGKKLQLLSLLSGGEQALTAIALLFAILKLKPAAFCILDEIDTSLDEANVDCFAEYLRKYSRVPNSLSSHIVRVQWLFAIHSTVCPWRKKVYPRLFRQDWTDI